MLSAVLVLAGLFVFWPALHGAWLWDDSYLFVYNRDMRTLGGLERIWFGHTQMDYWPLTSTVLWAEVHLWGSHPMPYHGVSLALHLCSAFLLWWLFARLGLESTWAWLGALLFVIHPLVVESVAWLSELKNTLSLPLLLLAVLAWLDFDAERRPRDYGRALFYYVLAMLAKTSVIMLPAVLLLYAWWKHGRVTLNDLKRTVPFFLIAALLGVITKASQSNYRLMDDVLQHLTVLSHLACAGSATFFYLGQFFFPGRMLPIYPRWSVEPPTAVQLAELPAIALVLAALWTQRQGWGRHALLGLGFFLLNLLPVSGLLIMSYMNIAWVADHLAYLPMIGLIGLVVAGLQALDGALPRARTFLQAGICAACLFLAWSSHVYAHYFINEIVLWTYTAKYNPDSWDAQTNLATSCLRSGHADVALPHAQRALNLRPDLPQSYGAMGDVLAQIPDRLPEAISAYEAALARDAYFPRAHVSLGAVDEKMGKLPEAMAEYRTAIAQDGNDARAHTALADALARDPAHGDEAVAEFRAALTILPDDAATHMDLANVLASRPEHLPEAEVEYKAAAALAPYDADVYNDYGCALMKAQGRLADAVTELQTAVRLRPDYAVAHYNLGLALERSPGHLPDAAAEFETVLRLQPTHLGAQYYLAVALAQIPGRAAEAVPLLESVVQGRPDFAPAQELLAKLRAGN